jgi:hypothetical protein
VSLRCFLYVVNKFRSSEPTLLSLNISVRGSPTNLFTPKLEVSFALLPFFL